MLNNMRNNKPILTIKHLLISIGFISLVSCGGGLFERGGLFESSEVTKQILVFTKTAGFKHKSIPAGVKLIEQLGLNNQFSTTVTDDAAVFNHDKSLKRFAAVVFLNTTGDALNDQQQYHFERYIQAGGGFVGIHAATDTEYQWPWYNQLVGAYFDGHPKVQEAQLTVVDKDHAATSMFDQTFKWTDEWYNFKNINPNLNILLTIDESSYQGGKNGKSHPVSWYHPFDGGRAFYTVMGHTNDTFNHPVFAQHLLGGIRYAMGDGRLDYSPKVLGSMPHESRFKRTILAQNLEEPMELVYLPDQKILFIERKGDIKTFDLKSGQLATVAHLSVQHAPGEDGLLGLAMDPDYSDNHWIYLYHTPTIEDEKKDRSVQRLSRFVFKNDRLDVGSEKILLEIPSARDCCHAGGSIEFGPDGLLFIATGDNTSPFKSNGYSPSDEGPGRSKFDAQKSSANTNDLRGKILRIKPEGDGTYTIPEGNLFPVATHNARAEIYTMGLRNPFRISVDQKNGFLYWGDVGPDAGGDGVGRGPKGLDELNQARAPGNWGWPYTRGNNQAYYDYDFAHQKSRGPYNPNNLINDSPNNTGLRKLPSAQKSFLWYSYRQSKDFPWMGTGGKNPMAGPIFYSDLNGQGDDPYPDYFDGKLFFYEWARSWIYVITMDEDHHFRRAERFMPDSVFARPTDMIFGDDGNLYLLEYGKKWRTRNTDARLNRIEYFSGNRNPVAKFEMDKSAGSLPLTIKFNAKQSVDYDGDPIKFEWKIIGGVVSGTAKGVNTEYTFTEPGNYDVVLKITDSHGLVSHSKQKVIAGNTPPTVDIVFDPVQPTYGTAESVNYKVVVTDAEDGSSGNSDFDSSRVVVEVHYFKHGIKSLGKQAVGHQPNLAPVGKKALEASDCLICHDVDEKVAGPSFKDISERYTTQDIAYLVSKVIKGGAGEWGDAPMSAHPQLSEDDVKSMVDYIMSFKSDDEDKLLATDTLLFNKHSNSVKHHHAIYVLTARYTDKGNGEILPLTGQAMKIINRY
jgi:cytochrome c